MSLRRTRSHKVGVSNIDFITKGEIDNLKIYKPWKAPKDLGTMGYKNYRNPRPIFKSLFEPTEKINTFKDLVNDYPDPRYYTTAQFYKKNNILLNTKTFLNNEKASNLEETFKGKDVFNGDSMNVAEIMNSRKGKIFDKKNLVKKNLNKEPFSIEDNKIQEEKMENLKKYKEKLNKNAIQETQLVKINTFIEKDNEINLKKIEEIRQTLRRRYGNRKNINKIFQQWARTFPNKITIYDAYKMINSLSIPINYNETKAFIASGSNFGNEYLNIEEFSNLIYEPTSMNWGEKKFNYEEKDLNTIGNNIILINKTEIEGRNFDKLKNFIAQRILVLNKNLKELSKEKYSFKEGNVNKNESNLNLVDFDKFKKGILSLKPSDNFNKEEYIQKLFNEYKGKNDLVDMRYFCENIYEKTKNEFMSQMKDKTIEINKEQYIIKKNKLQNYINENKDRVKPLVFQKKIDLDKQLFEKNASLIERKKEEKKIQDQVNCTIPSTSWLHHIYDNRKEHYNKLNRAEHALSAKPTFKQNNLIRNTRFGAVPQWRKTSEILIGDETCGTYINEKDRFNIDRDIAKDDKKMKNMLALGKQNRIKTAIQKYEDNRFMKIYLQEEKDIYSNMEKSKKLSIYDERSKNMNFIIE